ncbi:MULTISPECIES: cyclic-di-AMP-binding protein CbpB [Lactobacillus]|uniref:CBS domain containing protein n=2 Tax=Lactobacillus apis TaxID=303541 RepID=A0A0F4LP71_9LACO|nr:MULTISPECIES: cyclic-di-AMP-binding protein CbpB [Lactobacillus]KJY60093.1 CBS domain containing protein [Lactobacillus apis]MBI0022679.1 CBS domain-containing protein [Lactobacillus sp. W8172]
MFSPSIQRLLEDKSGSFIIPASRIAFVEDDNPLYHAFMVLTRVKYSKIPVLDSKNQVVGLLSLAMITDKMMVTDKITLDPLTELKVKDVMQTNFDKINFAQTTLETQLHLLVDNAFLPVVDDYGVFQGLLTRREWIKAFNYVAHNFENKYQVKQI